MSSFIGQYIPFDKVTFVMRAQLAVILFASIICNDALAQNWQSVTDPARLTAILSDVELTGKLTDKTDARAVYRSDGSADLHAWGGIFPRSWRVIDGKVCINSPQKKWCSTLEEDSAGQRYRATNVATGESVIFRMTADTLASEVGRAAPSGGATTPSAEEMARELANPNTALASMKLKLQYRTFEGDLPGAGSQDSTMLLFQPSFPFPLDKPGESILFRPAIPIFLEQPYFDASTGEFDTTAALGDISFDLAYSKSTASGLLLAAGVIATLPTATEDEVGKDLWSAGPEILVGKITQTYVVGAYPNHQWDFAGDGDGEVNITSGQLFGIYLPGGGWNIGSVPIISYDWTIDEWTVPLNFTFGKTTVIAGRPWKFGVEVNYYVEQPDAFGPEWMIGIDITPVVENKMANWFR